MQQSPSWASNNSPSSQEVPRILWNPRDHYNVHHRQPFFLMLSQIDTLHPLKSDVSKMHFNIIIPSAPTFSKFCSFLQVSSPKFCMHLFFHIHFACRAPSPFFFFLGIPKNIWRGHKCTGLFKMIVGVLTTCHTQYTWDRSICFFFI